MFVFLSCRDTRADIYMSWRSWFNAFTFCTFTVCGGCFLSQGVKNEIILTLPPPPLPLPLPPSSAFGLFFAFSPSPDFNLPGTADWHPLLSLHVTVVEISLRGSMQISSGDVDKQRQSRGIRSAEGGRVDKGNDGKCSICIWDAQIHKKIPVSLMGFFFCCREILYHTLTAKRI